MATAASTAYPHIVKVSGYCGGKAAIDRTRVRVNNVVFLHKEGKTAGEILVEYPDLTPAQVHAALTYYYDHQQEIEAELAAEEGWEGRHERRKADAVGRRAGK